MPRYRRLKQPAADAAAPLQREVLREVMLSAGECGAWLTLRELALLTNYGEASISAQLRHLRKPVFGGLVVKKRRRSGAGVTRGDLAWEYHVSGAPRRSAGAADARSSMGVPDLCANASRAREHTVQGETETT